MHVRLFHALLNVCRMPIVDKAVVIVIVACIALAVGGAVDVDVVFIFGATLVLVVEPAFIVQLTLVIRGTEVSPQLGVREGSSSPSLAHRHSISRGSSDSVCFRPIWY